MNARDAFDAMDLNAGPRNVLIVEDYVPMAEHLGNLLAESGHDCRILLGIDAINGDIAVGPGVDGEPVTVMLRSFQAAFLDHYFLSSRFNGQDVTRVLRGLGDARILAMSSDAGANAKMLKAGATIAIRKSVLRAML